MRLIVTSLLGFILANPAFAAGATPEVEGVTLFVYCMVAAFSYVSALVASRMGQAGVLGALVGGVLLSAVAHFTGAFSLPPLKLVTTIGMVIILFEAGLHARVEDMLKELSASTKVAIIGIALPLGGGILWAQYAWGSESLVEILSVGVALTATSVGISYKVFELLKMHTSREAIIVIGAAVLDDVVGMALLAALSGIAVSSASGGGLSWSALIPFGIGLTFVAGFSAVGYFLNRIIPGERRSLAIAILILGLALWIATELEIAWIIAGFVAGFVISAAPELDDVVKGLGKLLYAPAFLAVGLLMDWSVVSWDLVPHIAVLTVVAFLTKLVSGLGAPKGTNRLMIGAAMASRGEVGLAVVAITLDAGSISSEMFAVLTSVIILVTIIAPICMKAVAKPVKA